MFNIHMIDGCNLQTEYESSIEAANPMDALEQWLGNNFKHACIYLLDKYHMMEKLGASEIKWIRGAGAKNFYVCLTWNDEIEKLIAHYPAIVLVVED